MNTDLTLSRQENKTWAIQAWFYMLIQNLIRLKWYFTEISMCISLMIHNVEFFYIFGAITLLRKDFTHGLLVTILDHIFTEYFPLILMELYMSINYKLTQKYRFEHSLMTTAMMNFVCQTGWVKGCSAAKKFVYGSIMSVYL